MARACCHGSVPDAAPLASAMAAIARAPGVNASPASAAWRRKPRRALMLGESLCCWVMLSPSFIRVVVFAEVNLGRDRARPVVQHRARIKAGALQIVPIIVR